MNGIIIESKAVSTQDLMLRMRILELERELKEANKIIDYDELTGLLSRKGFLKLVGAPKTGALLFIDLDKFKPVNDTHGHDTGDMILKKIAGIFQVLSQSNLLARLHGDEFVIYIDGGTQEAGEDLAVTICEALKGLEFYIDGSKHTITASIGVASVKDGEISLSKLMHIADKDMYKKKEERGE